MQQEPPERPVQAPGKGSSLFLFQAKVAGSIKAAGSCVRRKDMDIQVGDPIVSGDHFCVLYKILCNALHQRAAVMSMSLSDDE